MKSYQLFSFLQYTVNPTGKPFESCFSDEDWHRLYAFCKQQALIGIGFSGIEELCKQGVECPKPLMLQWMSLAIRIERRNKQMSVACGKVTTMFARDGMNCCVLKGQGNLFNYPENLSYRRQSGDIDLWVVPGNGKRKAVRDVIAYVKKHPGRHRAIYHHIDMSGPDGIELEIHYRPSFLKSFLRNWRLQRWFREKADECMKNRTSLGFSIPTASVNVVYQMTHIFSHFFEEGIGLRQLLDYFFVLKTWYREYPDGDRTRPTDMQTEVSDVSVMSAEEVMGVLGSFGMARFAGAVMWVLQRVFAMPDEWLICVPDEKRGEQLLDEIMQAGNFGQYDERGKGMKQGGTISHGIWKLRRMMRLVRYYPEEALSEPLFRVWHFGWRCLH